jgi:hypothetical protein
VKETSSLRRFNCNFLFFVLGTLQLNLNFVNTIKKACISYMFKGYIIFL